MTSSAISRMSSTRNSTRICSRVPTRFRAEERRQEDSPPRDEAGPTDGPRAPSLWGFSLWILMLRWTSICVLTHLSDRAARAYRPERVRKRCDATEDSQRRQPVTFTERTEDAAGGGRASQAKGLARWALPPIEPFAHAPGDGVGLVHVLVGLVHLGLRGLDLLAVGRQLADDLLARFLNVGDQVPGAAELGLLLLEPVRRGLHPPSVRRVDRRLLRRAATAAAQEQRGLGFLQLPLISLNRSRCRRLFIFRHGSHLQLHLRDEILAFRNNVCGAGTLRLLEHFLKLTLVFPEASPLERRHGSSSQGRPPPPKLGCEIQKKGEN
mmetsp:Transcript_92994/g.265487  ORF Transcript_92994/g.265487 Transcript_92994/m.265487 type:complete len:324 (-) Transcript_92994:157-1128(-)